MKLMHSGILTILATLLTASPPAISSDQQPPRAVESAGSLEISPIIIDFPTFTHHGEQRDISLTLNNLSDSTVNYTTNILEDTGPTGWLTVTGLAGTIPAGLSSSDTGTIHLNTGGIVNAPGTIMALLGGIEIVSNLQTSPDTIPVRCWVADTVVAPELDLSSKQNISRDL